MYAQGTLSQAIEDGRNGARESSWSAATTVTYTSALNSWKRYCKLTDVNWNCLYSNGVVFDVNKMEDVISGFMSLQCVMRSLAPDTIMYTYLPGIAAWFDRLREKCNIVFRIAISSKEQKFVHRGLARVYDRLNPVSGRVKLAYGIDLALKSISSMRNRNMFKNSNAGSSIMQTRAFVCQCVGIYFLLRRSEHIEAKVGTAKGTAITLTRKHITFFDSSGRPIPYMNVKRVRAVSVALNIEFAKTDSSGKGRITKHERQGPDAAVCIVSILENWIAETRDKFHTQEGESLYAIHGYEKFTIDDLHKVMQYTLDDLHIPGLRATSHSLRYGGATMLAAAGFPVYTIAMYGGWAPDSKSLRFYTKASEQMVGLVSAHMARMASEDSSKFFVNDLLIIAKTR